MAYNRTTKAMDESNKIKPCMINKRKKPKKSIFTFQQNPVSDPKP